MTKKNQRSDGSSISPDTLTLGKEGTTCSIAADLLNVANIKATTIGTGVTNRLSIAGNVNVSVGNIDIRWNVTRLLNMVSNVTCSYVSATAYGNGTYVIVDVSGNVLTSKDEGKTWTAQRFGTTAAIIRSLEYGNGKFVLCTEENPGNNYTSTDGITWSSPNTMPAPNIVGINWLTFGNGWFVGVSKGGAIFRSTDGVDWTRRQNIAGSWNGVTFLGDRFIACGTNVIATSDDANGTTFTTVATPTGDWKSIAYGNGIYMVVSFSGIVATSSNTTTWTTIATFGGQQLRGVFYKKNTWILIGVPGLLFSYDNGTSWMNANLGTGAYFNYMNYANDKIISGGLGNQNIISQITVRKDGTNMTADVLTLGNEGTTTNLGAPLTIGYSPYSITSPNQIGYTTEDPLKQDTMYQGGRYLFESNVLLPAGVWLVSYAMRWSVYGTLTTINSYGFDSINGATRPYGQYLFTASTTTKVSDVYGTTGTFVITSNGSLSYNIACFMSFSTSEPYAVPVTSGNYRSLVTRTRIA